MNQKPQYVDGSYMGHDIEVRIDEVLPFTELSEVPGDVFSQILRELLYTQDGVIDMDTMIDEHHPVHIKGSWRVTIFPENLETRLNEITKAALEYIINSIQPVSMIDWPDKDTRVEWVPDSGGIREGTIHTIVHKDKGDIRVGVEDCDDYTNKVVKLSDFNVDSLIYIATTLRTDKSE